jgi:DNA-binding LacI/PurR family transcriptional regulator
VEVLPSWNCFHLGGLDDGTTSIRQVARRVNIAAVANEAGVGIGTVSRVINGSPNVRPTTRQQVLEVIERLNYRPSRLAAGLSRGRTGAVGILVPFLTRPSVVERLAGAIAVFDEQGYDTVVFNVESPQQRDRHVEALLSQHRADGVMVFSLRLADAQLAAFKRAHVPLSMVDVDAAGVPSAVIDDVDGGRLATAHLLELQHRRIGFIGDRSQRGLGFRSGRRRLTGYYRALEAAGVTLDPALVQVGASSSDAATTLAAVLLTRPDPPTAIFAASDTQAMGVLAAAANLDIEIPDELSVIGFDDIETAALLQLSTVRQPLAMSGAEGARRLAAQLRGEVVRPISTRLPLEVIQRASTAKRPGVRPVRTGRVRPRPESADRPESPDRPETAEGIGPVDGRERGRPAQARASPGPRPPVLRTGAAGSRPTAPHAGTGRQ